jgi:hypothetical protein
MSFYLFSGPIIAQQLSAVYSLFQIVTEKNIAGERRNQIDL